MIEPPAFDAAAFAVTGCARWQGAVSPEAVSQLCTLTPSVKAGTRLSLVSPLAGLAVAALQPLIGSLGRSGLRPVRCILFDKSAAANWLVPWHQDRTIAVAARQDVCGYGPWSIKDGVNHVEPPFSLLAEMLTLRLHLDDCRADNAPLLVVRGSHLERHGAADVAAIADAGDVLTCIADAGDVWLYSTPIIHSSRRAAHPSRRRVLQIDYNDGLLPAALAWAA